MYNVHERHDMHIHVHVAAIIVHLNIRTQCLHELYLITNAMLDLHFQSPDTVTSMENIHRSLTVIFMHLTKPPTLIQPSSKYVTSD